ncbi:MAG: hypothetical protein K9J37_15370 [Saprospiraceae bacterium]|nr:hypothetical protein [Saprospiraceae bacterium]MCF8251291.1 hypothetical protein [Saprospiraceae bacterium]MCF8280818.1 hypothetical protein [Bacteroidales bacterium]MCF8311828.1 hypothetical protein [Saprospiraceae bacterium]MCF8441969.1 hypothetical protein [Saprospiraceae bacterium]
MKKLMFSFSIALAIVVITSCQKDPKEAILPEEVEFGESVIYLNGELADYLPVFNHDTINYLLNFPLVETKNQGQLVNSLSFDWLPLREGEYKLITKREPRVNALTDFSQTVAEDLSGYEYELMDADEGFFNIEYLDSINMEVKGRFKAKFCRTKKNGTKDGDLPKNIVFQGVFYEKYTYR